MTMAKVIPLFGGERPATIDADTWEYWREYAENNVLNLEGIVRDMAEATTEAQFLDAVSELRAEVERLPATD